MARISPGNALYLYRLLKGVLGTGRQSALSAVEEALDADGISPADLDCADVAELLGELGDFVRLTHFKGGRLYATVQASPELDAALERSDSAGAEKGGRDGKPWKRARGPKALRPVRPRHRKPAPEPAPMPEPEVPQAPDAEGEAPEAGPTPTPTAASAPEPPASPTDAPEGTETSQGPAAEPAPGVAGTSPAPEAGPAPTPQPEPPAPAPTAPEPASAPAVEPAAPAVHAGASEGTPAGSPPVHLQSDLPQSFSAEVHCKDATLALLYRILPLDEDVMSLLDEDWRVARSTGALSGTRSKVTFPLRYLREDGSAPVEVTLRRTARPVAGKRWSLAYVDGDDGTGGTHEAAGIEGLPASEEGAWADLAPARAVGAPTAPSPARELAQFAVIGSWEALLGRLAATAAPERWNYPGEGVGGPSRYGILRDYLCATFHRARATGLLVEAPDGSLAAFDTGLLTAFGRDVYACFEPRRGDIPWQFAGFACAGSGELGARVSGLLDPLPAPPSYLTELSDVRPEPGRLVVIDYERVLGPQLGRLPRAFLAEQLEANSELAALLGRTAPDGDMRALARAVRSDPGTYRRLVRALDEACEAALLRCRVSYRTAAPAYDPVRDATCLLVPLCLVDETRADCALALVRQPSGNYQGVSVLPLARAYACARIVSSEQPAWLGPEAALA